jgi:hypothetical protein
LTKKNPPKNKNKKIPPFFISLKVALGAQEAPQFFLELSLIGKAKIIQGFLKGPLCEGALSNFKKKKLGLTVSISLRQQLQVHGKSYF